jgi:hypothetical protein
MRTVFHQESQRGFIAILTVIVLLAFSVSIMLGGTYLSIDQSQTGLVTVQGEVALQLTHGCAEDALLMAYRDENYEGGSVDLLNGTCEITVEKNGSTWDFRVVGQKNNFERILLITVEREPGSPGIITLTSWREE